MIKYQSIVKAIVVFIIINCQLIMVNGLNAQTDYSQQYAFAKSLFRDGKYNLAMESLRP